MYSSLKTLFILLALALTVSGCGDLLGTKVKKRAIGQGIAEVGCELDLDRFSEILHDNIGPDIRCLGANLNLFIRVVKSGKPGYLSREQLERYLATHRPDVKPEVIRALKAVFDLGHLITGDDPNYISKDTVDKVISFALIFNQEAALNFRPTFQNESEVSYALHQNHRDRVSAANKAIVQALRNIFDPGTESKPRKLNIIELLESFSTDTTADIIEKAKKVLFVKKILLGGENEVITHQEIERLILNFDQLSLIALDIVRYKYIILNQESILHLIKGDVDQLHKVINQSSMGNRDQELLFTMDELIEGAKIFLVDLDINIEEYRDLIAEVKKIAMKGNATEVRGAELNNLFGHAKSLLQTGTIFHRIWNKFKVQLLSPRPVEETIDFDEYRHTYPDHQAELDQFERIAKKYRFMKGEFLSSYYMKGFKRNADAMFEIALFEYVIKMVFATYGSPSPNADAVGGYSINKDQMIKLVQKFENVLIDLELLTPQRAVSTADNISLLGTLFQYQSDKNSVLDVNEATEFFISLFSALNMSEDMHGYFKERNCSFDEFDRTNPECFKANFWPALCKHYKQYFPLMFESFNIPKNCDEMEFTPEPNQAPSWVTPELNVFLDKSISAARTCNFYTDGNQEEIPYSKGDIMTIMLAIMHAETTVLRWDVNGNNVMDADEVNRSYEIYSPALDGFLESKSVIIQKLKKQIFQYMIKYEQIPDEKDFGSIWKFVKFLLSFNKKAPANRKTIVSLLDAVGKENAKISTGPKFDCNLMRDPENIPREPVTFASASRMTSLGIVEDELNQVLPATTQLMKSFNEEEKEILKDQLFLFSDDMAEGRISAIKNVKQKELKGLFNAISKDSSKMREIRSVVKDGNDLHKIALTVSALLVDEKTK